MTDVLERTPPEPLRPRLRGAHAEHAEPPVPGWLDRLAHRIGSISLEGWITSASWWARSSTRSPSCTPTCSSRTPRRPAATWAPTSGARPTSATTSCRTSASRAGRPTGTPASRCTTSTWSSRRCWWCSLDLVLPYGRRAQARVGRGILTLPDRCWAFGKLRGLRFPVPPLLRRRRRRLPLRRDTSRSTAATSPRRWRASSRSRSRCRSACCLLRRPRLRAAHRQAPGLAAVLFALAVLCHLHRHVLRRRRRAVVLVPARTAGPAAAASTLATIGSSARLLAAFWVHARSVAAPPLHDRHGLRAATPTTWTCCFPSPTWKSGSSCCFALGALGLIASVVPPARAGSLSSAS